MVTPRTIAPAFLRGATSGGVVAWDEAGAQARSGLAAQTDHVDRLLMLIRNSMQRTESLSTHDGGFYVSSGTPGAVCVPVHVGV